MANNVEPFYRELGRKIRERRIQFKLTQGNLGELLDPQVTRASIANIETGTQRVLAHTLAQLAYHLEVSVQDLLPSTDPGVDDQNEGVAIVNELTRRLRLPEKQLKRLVRKLKKQTIQL